MPGSKELHELDGRGSKTGIALRSIMAATDFSATSVSVLTHAAAMARRYRSKLYVVHVISPDIYKSVPPEVMEEALKQTRAYVQDALANQLRLKLLQRLKSEGVIREGSVGPELLRLAAELETGMLVIGTRGHRGLDRLLQGSVAEEIFRQAPCPVLVVPPSANEQAGIPIRTILYPTSFSENSIRAAPYAFSLARTYRARLILLHVLKETMVQSRDDLARLRKPIEKRLQELLPAKDGPGREPLLYVEFGPVAKEICRIAWENQGDLIVLGIAGAGATVAHLAEGLTYKIVREAPCPVLTIRG